MPPMMQFDALLKRLTDAGVEFVIIGGVAAVLLGSPVMTGDLDICADLGPVNMPKILAALRGLHPCWRTRPDLLPLAQDPDSLRDFKNLYLNTDMGILDILSDLPGVGAFADLAGRTITLQIAEISVRVLNLDTLILSKQAAGRAKDKYALMHLEALQRKQSD